MTVSAYLHRRIGPAFRFRNVSADPETRARARSQIRRMIRALRGMR